ncbi:histidinol dehydrogenase [bacterium]|nr:histidinol dehydrogenase [bacterium]
MNAVLPSMKRLDLVRNPGEGEAFLENLRRSLSPRGDIVSPKGRELTEKVFGEALAPVAVVDRILGEIRETGLAALLKFTEQLDGKSLTPESMRVSPSELQAAAEKADPEYLATIDRIRANVLAFQRSILHTDSQPLTTIDGKIWLRYRPLRRIGVCIPGGAAAYPSSLIMTVVPAQAAGVKEIAVVVPPTPFGGYNDDLLAACHRLGVTEVYRVGGAQAVGALAYGVEGIAPVDKIVGPGNLFVALAKKAVYGQVDIDSIAGPSEVILIADSTARPEFIAADLISQAEHSPGSSLLVTWDEGLIERVAEALDDQLGRLSRGDLARDSLERFGALVRVADADAAVALTNRMAPEHLHISTVEPEKLAERLTDAGAIFLGHHTPVAAGDYAAGPSHVLPTGGTARWASGLTANHFLRSTSMIGLTETGLGQIAGDITRLAEIEGLTAHKASVTVRTEGSID